MLQLSSAVPPREQLACGLTPLVSAVVQLNDDDDAAAHAMLQEMEDLSDDELLFVKRWGSPRSGGCEKDEDDGLAGVCHVTPDACMTRVLDAMIWSNAITLVFAACSADVFLWERCVSSRSTGASLTFSLTPGYFDELFSALDTHLRMWQEQVRGSGCSVLFRMSKTYAAEFAFRCDAEVLPLTGTMGYRHEVGARMWPKPSAASAEAALPVTISLTFGRTGYGSEECAPFVESVTNAFCWQFMLPVLETYAHTHVELVTDGEFTRYCLSPRPLTYWV